MSEISEIQPKNVFSFFEKISQIPHGSGNTSALADYCLRFAEKRGLEAQRDFYGNVIIRKGGTESYEKSEPVILQGHLDMVCEKSSDCEMDMSKEGIKLCTDGEYIYGEGTTLGGDDGIAIAYILAVLDSHDLPHPPIEAVFTADEEIGLVGANKLDASTLKGKRIINIDSEEEGILTVSCAGGVRAFCRFDLDFVPSAENEGAVTVKIDGLKGGHSGIDIGLRRTNAHVLMGRLLQHIERTEDFTVAGLSGGTRTNVIPNHAEATLCAKRDRLSYIVSSVENFGKIISDELCSTEPNVKITACETALPEEHSDSESTRKLIFILQQIPDGIMSMCPDIPNMVQTSLNMGELALEKHSLKLGYLIRSNASTGKQQTVVKLKSFVDYLRGKIDFAADYPVWEYRADSPLRDIMVKAYEDVYAQKPKIQSIHAGLECGILAGKIDGADIVSFGPDLENVHTPNERMSIASAGRCWKYLVKALEMLK